MHQYSRAAIFALALSCAVPASAQVIPSSNGRAGHAIDPVAIRLVGEMMGSLAAESRRDAERIKSAYGRAARTTGLRTRSALARSLDSGFLAPLPPNAERFNLALRLDGRHPIGEKDLDHQELYVAARPATLGVLLHVASRVRSMPLDVTSLVRHHAYQRALQRTNANARTSVPTHALGLAFDISVLHATPQAAAEIRDVLRHMREAGALFFIAEQRQLVFHVVPAPRMLGFYAALYEGLSEIPATRPMRPPLPLIVEAPPAPDLAWLETARSAGGVPPVALTSALVGALAASGAGASMARRRSGRRRAGLSLR